MPYYPVILTVVRNLRQAITPMRSAEVYVFRGNTNEQLPVFPDYTGTPGTDLVQPILTDLNGMVIFYVSPGRVRIDAVLDPVTTESTELVVPNEDENVQPIFGEELGPGNGISSVYALSRTPFEDKVAIYVAGRRFKRVPLTINPVGDQFSVNVTLINLGITPMSGDPILADYVPRKVAL